MTAWPHKLAQSVDEIGVCLARGATFGDRLGLVRGTAQFHLGNRLQRQPDLDHAQDYRVRVASRVVDLKLRAGAGDFFVFHEVFAGDYYALPEGWKRRIRTVVDLGAHIGLTALYFLEALPDARIVCVEAAADNARLLRHNLAAFPDRATVIEAAAGVVSGHVTFEPTGWSWQRRVREDGGTGLTIPSLSIDDIMQKTGLDSIDLLKVDVEGAEEAIFERAGAWLDRVGAIVIELHEPYSLERFTERVTRAGFTLVAPEDGFGNRMIVATRHA